VIAVHNIFGSVFCYKLIVVVHCCSPFDKIRGSRHPIAELKEGDHYIGT
jgi:hypothetical protein